MTSATTTRVPATGGGELCRLTIAGPDRRADLGVPVGVPVGDLLPLLLPHLVDASAAGSPIGAERGGEWALQRLGGPPLDLDASVEALGLADGEILYLNPAPQALPDLVFDDLAVGVAGAVAARPDRWRPALREWLLLGLGAVVIAAVPATVLDATQRWLPGLCLSVAAVALTATAGVLSRLAGQRAAAAVAGLGACVCAALSGLTALGGSTALGGGTGGFAPGHDGVLWAGINASVAAAAVMIAGRAPVALFGAALGTGAAAVVGSLAASALPLSPARIAAVLAVALFAAATPAARLGLRLARLHVPRLPHTAQDLAIDLEAEPAAQVNRRAGNASGYLTALTATTSGVAVTAFVLLLEVPGWAAWALTATLGGALLLRARGLAGAWQRLSLGLAGTLGLVLAAVSRAVAGPAPVRVVTMLGLLAAGVALLAAARPRRAARGLPLWGHLADQLRLWTAIALLPLLVALLDGYAFFRSLVG